MCEAKVKGILATFTGYLDLVAGCEEGLMMQLSVRWKEWDQISPHMGLWSGGVKKTPKHVLYTLHDSGPDLKLKAFK